MKPTVIIHEPEQGCWLSFENPVRILVARTPDEILPALRDLENTVARSGLFAAGYLSYEAAPAFDPAYRVRPDPSGFPLLWFGLYPAPRQSPTLPLPAEAPAPLPPECWTPSISAADYALAVGRLHRCLFEGETYQINYSFRLTHPLQAPPESVFAALVEAQGAHYSAFLDLGTHVICSASPELFFRLEGDQIESRPMKGTLPRGKSAEEDRSQVRALRDSPKNRAENVMIVDMIRNDLGRVAIPGTVVPSRLFEIERYPTVWQMVSTVTARTNASLTGILTALFPCASITGAPKPKTMEIIAREETTPRRIYTGSIGYLGPNRRAQFNVAIRTLLFDRGSGMAEYGTGGGIVWDSESSDEYGECWLKARVLTETQPDFQLLETLLWTPGEDSRAGFFLLERHLRRLADSADYFGIPVERDLLRTRLQELARTFTCPQRVRLLVDRNGTITLESGLLEVTPASAPVAVRIAAEPIDPANRFLYHKTTHRGVYERARAGVPDGEDVLLWNSTGELTESTIANVVVEWNGELLTPPVSCGLLPGVFRAELLARGEIREAVIRIEDLPHCSALHLINSVRQWRPARLTGSK